MKDFRVSVVTTLVILVCIAVGLLLRLHFISSLSISLDEAQSIWQAQHTLWGSDSIFVVMAKDIHPPLFVLMLHFWIQQFGQGAFIDRILPLIFGMLSIPPFYFLVKEVYTRKEGIFAVAIAGCGPLWIWYSIDIKNYSLLIFGTILSLLSFFKIVHNNHPRTWMIFFFLSQILGMYSHYFFFLIILLEFIGAFIYKKKSIIILSLLSAIFFIPWGYEFLLFHSSSTQPSLGQVNLFNILLTIFELVLGYHSTDFYKASIALWPLVILFFFVYIKAFRKVNKDSMLLLIAIILPIAGTFIVSQISVTIFLTRYLLFVSIFLYMVISRSIFSAKYVPYRLVGTVGFLILLLFMTYTQFSDPLNISVEDYKDSVAYVEQYATPHSLIIVSAPFTIYPFEYYYSGNAPYVTLPLWDRKHPINFAPTPGQMAALVSSSEKTYSKIFLIESYDQGHNNETVSWFNNKFKIIRQENFGYNVSVHEYQISYDTHALANR